MSRYTPCVIVKDVTGKDRIIFTGKITTVKEGGTFRYLESTYYNTSVVYFIEGEIMYVRLPMSVKDFYNLITEV